MSADEAEFHPLTFTAIHQTEVVINGGAELLAWRERHCLPVPGHEYVPRFRSGRWDGTWTPGKWCRENGDGSFELRCSRGLLPRIVSDLGGAVEFNVVTQAEVDEFLASDEKYATLRDYQVRALTRVLTEGWGRIAFATNAGKGAVIALLAVFAAQRKHQVLITCDEIAVFDALLDEIRTWGNMEPGVVRAGTKDIPTGRVVLAMIPTLVRRVDKSDAWRQWLGQQSMLLLDEADKGQADTWKLIMNAAKHTVWRAGFSGTFPDDLFNDLKMDELMGPVLERVKNKEMVERGVSAKPTIEVHSRNAITSLRIPQDWRDLSGPARRQFVYEAVIVYNEERHAFIQSLIRPDTPTAIVVNRIDHGQALADAIPGSVFIDGSASEDERSLALTRFKKREFHTLIVTKILDRGTNRLGIAEDMIFASGEGSSSQILQRLGRGLRRADGKAALRLVDVVDRFNTEDVSDRRLRAAASFLHTAARKRMHVYREEGFDIGLVRHE